MRHLVGLISFIALAGCASHKSRPMNWIVTYYDRNHDGIVDYEFHYLPDWLHLDYALCDTKFRGRYDLRINWTYEIQTERTDLPVPKGVKITHGKLPGYGISQVLRKKI